MLGSTPAVERALAQTISSSAPESAPAAGSAGTPDAPSLALPVSLDRIREALNQPIDVSLLRDVPIPADFRIKIVEQRKIDEMLSRLDFRGGPVPAGGLHAFEQQQRLFKPTDRPLMQPYAAITPDSSSPSPPRTWPPGTSPGRWSTPLPAPPGRAPSAKRARRSTRRSPPIAPPAPTAARFSCVRRPTVEPGGTGGPGRAGLKDESSGPPDRALPGFGFVRGLTADLIRPPVPTRPTRPTRPTGPASTPHLTRNSIYPIIRLHG